MNPSAPEGYVVPAELLARIVLLLLLTRWWISHDRNCGKSLLIDFPINEENGDIYIATLYWMKNFPRIYLKNDKCMLLVHPLLQQQKCLYIWIDLVWSQRNTFNVLGSIKCSCTVICSLRSPRSSLFQFV